MSKITPGPWVFEETEHGYGFIISPPEEYEGLWFTAIVHCVDPLMREANARALSAVPEMMEALEADEKLFSAMVNVLDDEDLWPHVSMQVIKDRLTAARAALAKARGENE